MEKRVQGANEFIRGVIMKYDFERNTEWIIYLLIIAILVIGGLIGWLITETI